MNQFKFDTRRSFEDQISEQIGESPEVGDVVLVPLEVDLWWIRKADGPPNGKGLVPVSVILDGFTFKLGRGESRDPKGWVTNWEKFCKTDQYLFKHADEPDRSLNDALEEPIPGDILTAPMTITKIESRTGLLNTKWTVFTLEFDPALVCNDRRDGPFSVRLYRSRALHEDR